jgi:hypothetical protein
VTYPVRVRVKPQRRERRGGEGPGGLTTLLQCCCSPLPQQGIRQAAGRVSGSKKKSPNPTKVSRLTKGSSIPFEFATSIVNIDSNGYISPFKI